MVGKKNLLKYTLKALVTLSLLVLFSLFFLQDQIIAYLKNRSTISSRYESSERQEFPTITLCFDSATKLSVSKKFGFTLSRDKFYKEILNKSLAEVFDESSYILERDFEVLFQHGESMKIGDFKAFEYEANSSLHEKTEEQLYLFDVASIRTYDHGTCTKIQPKFEVEKAPLGFEFTVSFSSKISKEDIPTSLTLYLTSNKTWLGIADSIWPQFNPLHEKVDFKRERTVFYLKNLDKYFRNGATNNTKCFEKLFLDYNCSTICTILDYYRGNLPLCQTVGELQCIWNQIYANYSPFTDCFKTTLATTYSLVERIDQPIHTEINTTSTTVWVGLWTMEKEVQEEVKLLTTEDFIGSVGGSLGMFFGFSIYATFLYCIDQVLNRFF